MKIAIVGPGAMGTLLAVLLTKGKEEVVLFDKDKERAGKLNKTGFSMEGVAGNWEGKIPVIAEPVQIKDAELIVIAVKSYDTKNALDMIKPGIGEDAVVLTLQNGIGNIDLLNEAIDQDNVVGGITSMGATLLGPGKVRYAGKGETVIGRLDAKTPVALRFIREAFNKAGCDTKISRDIKALLWSKLVINAGINALTAVTRLPNGKLIEFEGTRKILRAAVTEAVKIAKRKRIKLIYDDPLAKAEAVCFATAENISSMLQDILRKKRTEIDFINGAVVRLGQELGIAVPVNALLVDLIKTIEASYSVMV